VIELLESAEVRRQMGERGRELVRQRFTADHMVYRLMELYDDLLMAKKGAD